MNFQTNKITVGRQIGLIAGLRWRLALNSVRTTQAKFELAAKILLGLLSSVVVLGGGFGLGAAAYFAVAKRPELLVVLFLIVFVIWQFMSLLVGAFSVEFDFRNLLRFPLRFPAFYIISLAYGLFDFPAVMALIWLVCIGAGITLATPALLPWTLLILAAFAATNLLMNRLIFSWLERLLAQRGTREKFFMIFIATMLSIQFVGIAVERWGKQTLPYLQTLKPLLQALPPSLAGLGLEAVARTTALWSGKTAAATSFICLTAYAAVFGLLLRRRLLSQYRGEELGESETPQAVDKASSSSASVFSTAFFTSFLPGPVAAMVEKELRYMVRNGPLLMTLVIPPVMVLFFTMTWANPRHTPGFLQRSPDMMFPSSVGYALLVLAPFALNSFAYDGRGIQLLLAAPVRFREVLLGKNLALGGTILAEGLAIWGLVALLREPPSIATVAATLCMLLFAIFLNLTAGNVLSLRAPRGFDFGSFRQKQSPITVLAVLGIQLFLVIISVGVFIAARWLESMWIAAGIFLVLAVATLPVYSAVLDYCSGLALRRRETLTAELCK
ncbi:MAG: hypothetical protein HY234_06780 [Acidobacteria bacterium]|nr:hypothetical protein [Acidobacteriota bacterium]